MSDIINKKLGLFKKMRNYFFENLRNIFLILGLLILSFIFIQSYNYFQIQKIKKSSIDFFNSIENNQIVDNLSNLKDNKNIYSILASLNIIMSSNDKKDFKTSNVLYKELLLSNHLDNIYKSSIAIHAAYTLIDASYLEDTNKYIQDISFFINNIDDNVESYYSIKKELEYMQIVTQTEINNNNYKNNKILIDKFKEIYNSKLISSSVKERVKKIHEFHLYN